jgi:hypothetical protein
LSAVGKNPAEVAPQVPETTVTGAVPIPARGSALVSVQARLLAFEPLNFQDVLLRDRSDGTALASAGLRAFSQGCTPGPAILCLQDGRFEAKVAWKDFEGNTGMGQAVPLTANAGYFWFFGPENVELALKVLDGRSLNGQFWVFYGSLSTVEYVITVTDTETGASKTFFNPSGHLASVADIRALPAQETAENASETEAVHAKVDAASAFAELLETTAPAGSCTPSATALCLNGGRFRVEMEWKDFAGKAGLGQAVPLTGDSGFFWFFGPDNVELFLKILDGTPLNQHWWVFYGALSSVEYRITVTDTATGQVKMYVNPSGNLGSAADTSAFPE